MIWRLENCRLICSFGDYCQVRKKEKMDFDPRVGPVNLNGGSQDPEPAVGVAIFPAAVWAVAVYDIVVGVNCGAVVNAAAAAMVYTKAVAIE